MAGGGYFVLGYGPLAHQSGGTSTAVGLDAFSGATNPGKLWASGARTDLGMAVFSPYRRIERDGSGTIYDFDAVSKNSAFFLPEAGVARRINDQLSWGLSLYGNGGLNTEYHENNGVAASNFNPARCGDAPANFLFGCGNLGFDLSQILLAPTLSWKFAEGHGIGVAPLLGYQLFKAYGLQAFEGLSSNPDAVSNRGYDHALGAGLRVGWYGRIFSWLDLGASYSTRVYMERFKKYEGLLADRGDFDIPANYSIGAAIRPLRDLTIGLDIQRIEFGEIKALGNGVQNSLQDPAGSPLGSKGGSGFNWCNQTNYRVALIYALKPTLTLRGGYAYGRNPQRDRGPNSVSFNMLAPNPVRNVTLGFTWNYRDNSDFNFAFGRYLEAEYRGTSSTGGLGVGGTESVTPHVNTFWLGWSKRI